MAAAKESMPTAEHEQHEQEHDHAEQDWLEDAEQFERELRALASWHASSAADYVDEAISENWKFVPKKLQNKRSYYPPRYDTRKKVL